MLTYIGVLVLAACAGAITRDQFYPFGHGLDQRLPRGSQVSSPEVPLEVPVVFYGETYESIFVNNFGVLSFRSDISSFLNTEFPLPYPSIAAFYTNIDTTDSGAIYYRETNDTYALLKAEEAVQNNFLSYFDFRPTSVFIATWIDVTYKSREPQDRKNSFQVVVISNGTESFVELLYPEGEIQWIQKETQTSSLPEAKAQAGFIAEDGRIFTLRGSGSQQIRNIVTWSNTHDPGKYVFRVGDLPYDGNIAVPDQYDESELEVEEESKTCAQSGNSVCHIQARCVDYQAGICCKCNEDSYGNGKSCIKKDEPLRVHGKVNGVLNNINLNDVDIQAYVVVADGRSYTALSLVPMKLGSSLRLLNVLGGVVGWLFAKPTGSAKNGYEHTGAVFNHTADIYFPSTKDRVVINQEFLGHDVFDQIIVETDIRGTLPYLASGAKLDISEFEGQSGTKLHISEFEEQFTKIEPGLIRSESTRTFINKNTGEKYEQIVTQTFTFNPACRYAPSSEEDDMPVTLKVSKNYLGYEARDNIVRYGSSNKIIPLGQDPCREGRNNCGADSSCIVEGDSYICICQTGFTNIYHQNNSACIDIDECEAGTHNCDVNADCYNHQGGFECKCRHGFVGSGTTCEHTQKCTQHSCGFNARCVENQGKEPTCECSSGYVYDGDSCVRVNDNSCDYCHHQASCIFSETSNLYYCQCNSGYSGNGYQCEEESRQSYSERSRQDDRYAERRSERPRPGRPNYERPTTRRPESEEQYSENQYRESPVVEQPSTTEYVTDLESSPQPVYERSTREAEYNDSIVLPQCDAYRCVCPYGYTSYTDERNNDLCRLDSYYSTSVEPITENNDTSISCYSDADCPPNAVCIYSPTDGTAQYGHCVCPEGYEGDGLECIERTGSVCSCGPNAHCVDTANGEVLCICNSGYHGDGYTCRPNFSCTTSSDCEYNAECRLDPSNSDYVCQCIEGYIRDENDACIRDGQLCNGAVCPEHASCLYDETEQVSYCQCDQGYEGDGIVQCAPQGHSCDINNDCSPDAVCTPYDNTYQCICREGFTGDGYSCTPEVNCRTNPYLCDAHASCLKRSDGYVCECNTGYNGNGSYCELNPRKAGGFLVASDGASVYRVPFRTSPREFATPLNSAIYQIAVGVDVDCLTGRIYWGDVVGNAIKSAAYDGSAYDQFLSVDVKSPEGLAVDWSGRNVYWTDSKKYTIEVANIDTKVRKVLFSGNGITNPRGIAVHPQRGKIFWSDWNRADPKIEWATMDGSERGIFLDSSEVQLPNSLAIDWSRDRLCYADAGLHSIKCVDIDTREKETIAANCTYPFGLAINGNKFYWSDWKTLKIEYIDNETQQKGQVPIATASRRLYGVAVAPDSCPRVGNVCQHRNGNCELTQLCLPDGRGSRTCAEGESGY
ncbi:unnamed protein product [Chilo suppressalis]|uniref:EGF-like domain-containing protein n=2 Tax=Chilo suppressalis TaxID=168631 RepID=A0ABN8BH70_CHISP|nr:unnamed protein product [Chilo suppressalis]